MTHRICLTLGCIFLVATSRRSHEVSARTIVGVLNVLDQQRQVNQSPPVNRLESAIATNKIDTISSQYLKEDKEEIKLSSSGRQDLQRTGELRRINPFKLLTINSKPRVSPLYLINGTVCRFINFQPVCTTLSTTGLSGTTDSQFNFS